MDESCLEPLLSSKTTHEVGQKRPRQTNAVKLLGQIGTGVYGTVYALKIEDTGQEYAMKLLCKIDNNFTYTCDYAREIFGMYTSGLLKGFFACHLSGRFGLLMPLMGCRLGNSMVQMMSVPAAAALLEPIALSLNKMHGMHRDVKPSNIMLPRTAKDQCALVDFSLTTNMCKSRDDAVITLWYRPPEIIMGLEHTKISEVWSFGMVLLNVLTGILLNRCAVEENKSAFIIDLLDKFGWPKDWPEFYYSVEKIFNSNYRGHATGYLSFEALVAQSPEATSKHIACASDLLRGMLKICPKDRFTWNQVISHEFWTLKDDSQRPIKECAITYPSDIGDVSSFLKSSQLFESGAGQEALMLVKQQSDYAIDRSEYVGTMFGIIETFISKAKIYGFGESTAFYAISIMECAIFNGLKCDVEIFSACLFLAAAYNEDLRLHQYSWTTWTSKWDPASLTNCSKKFARATIKVLVHTRGYWPTVSWSSVFQSISEKIKSLTNEQVYQTTALFLLACPVPEKSEEISFVLTQIKKLTA